MARGTKCHNAHVICPHFGTCGGCASQNVPYPEQLEHKRHELARLLGVVLGGRAPVVLPLVGMPVGGDGMPWRFRHKAAFVFGHDPGSPESLVMGHYAAGSQRVVPVETCPVHSDTSRTASRSRSAISSPGRGSLQPVRSSMASCGTSSSGRRRTTAKRS
jgi:tRNA/tmRNA/rRNA uracil-C5-methylase (TrmA/RlmC/RlmD family)